MSIRRRRSRRHALMSALYASTSVAPEVTCEERSVTRRRAAADIARDSVRRGREGLEREERDANSRRFGDTRARARGVRSPRVAASEPFGEV